jgi:hypothetical protein
MKNLVIILGLLLAILVMAWLLLASPFSQLLTVTEIEDRNEVDLAAIKSFEDCEEAGFPVMESYPRQCALPDGRVYAEEIEVKPTYVNASADMIQVDNPYAGAVVGKEFMVTGEARGNWYFEASFPIEIQSENGDVIGGSIGTAEGDWMTEEFVPFKSEMIDLPSAFTGPAWLILKKDNPSGLPENDASVWIPIVVEY